VVLANAAPFCTGKLYHLGRPEIPEEVRDVSDYLNNVSQENYAVLILPCTHIMAYKWISNNPTQKNPNLGWPIYVSTIDNKQIIFRYGDNKPLNEYSATF